MDETNNINIKRKPKNFLEHFTLNRLLILLLILFVIVLLGPLLIKHHQLVHDPWMINDDQRAQIFEFYYENGEWLFKGDYISDFYKRVFYPLGFSMLYSVAGILGDPLIFSKYLQEFLFLLSLLFLFMIGKTQENSLVGIFCLLMGFVTDFYVNGIAGGLARSFAYPLIASFCWGMLRGNVWIVISMFLLQVLFYPPIALPCSITLAIWLLFPRLAGLDTGKLRFKSRLFILIAVAILSISFVMPNISNLAKYGEKITRNMRAEYPEAGPQGRTYIKDVGPFPSVISKIPEIVQVSFSGNGIFAIDNKVKNLLLLFTGLMSLIGWISLIKERSKACALIIFFISACLAYEIARFAHLYIPRRSLKVIPFIIHISLVFGFIEFLKVMFKKISFSENSNFMKTTVFLSAITMTFLFIDTKIPGSELYSEKRNAEFFNYLKNQLPQKALVAGWPSEVDAIPLLSKKRILVGKETFLPMRTHYILEMRRRTSALIDAYLSDDIESIKRLRDDFGVTHFIVHWKYFQPIQQDRDGQPLFISPTLFEPYQTQIYRLFFRVHPYDRAIFKLRKDIESIQIGDISIIDLTNINI